MSLLNQVSKEAESRIIDDDGRLPPVRINVQGIDGIGKSTFGADSINPIVIQAEDGLGYIEDVSRFSSQHMG